MKRGPAILIVCAVLALVTLACYWPVTAHMFVSVDDPRYICDNPHVKRGLTWSGVLWAFRSGYAGNWHPLTWISHMLDCQFYGLNPAGHHRTNLLFHIANSLLLLLLLQRMTGSLWRSACVAALFAWHPLHVESVAWAAERKDVLSTLFFLLTIWAYVRYAEKSMIRNQASGSPGTDDGRGTADSGSRVTHQASRYSVLSLFLFVLGLMSKPMLVTLPFVLLLLDYWPLQRLRFPALQSSRFKVHPPSAVVSTLHGVTEEGLRRTGGSGFEVSAPVLSPQSSTLWPLVREKLPFFVLALAASVVTYLVQQAGGAVSSLEVLPLQSRVANVVGVYVRYLWQSLWPAHLAVIYPYSRHLPVGAVAAAGLLLAGLSAWFALRARRHPFLTVGWFWYLGTLVPTIGLVQVGSQSMADRYMYIPSIGVFLLVVWGLDALLGSWPYKRCVLGTAATLALGGCLVCTRCQLKYWQDSELLYRHAIIAIANNYVAYDWLGVVLEAAGKSEEALACHYEAVRLDPQYPETQYRLGTALMKRGRLEEAIQHLTAAVKYNPAFASAHINLGKALLDQGKLPEAMEHLSKAVRFAPDDSEAHYNLGTIFFMQGKVDEAIVCFSEALRVNPDYGEAHGNLGIVLMRQGKLGEGATHLSAAARLNPNNPEAHDNLGLALLELNNPHEAANQFTEALRLNPNAPGAHYHLALALVRQDKAKEALLHVRKARDLALASGQAALAAEAEEFLKQHP
jgi:protein O-mannosyl-transferase